MDSKREWLKHKVQCPHDLPQWVRLQAHLNAGAAVVTFLSIQQNRIAIFTAVLLG
jgi:hypothetical protein